MSALQKKILSLLFIPLSTSLFFGCAGGTADSGGNSSEGVGVANLLYSKQGYSGGFVDVDGDGISDKLVGAPYATNFDQTGAVLVYKGNSTGTFSPAPTALLMGDDNFGFSFANLGDVDSDGISDYAIGAINGNGDGVSLSGAVYIYKGGSNSQLIKKPSGEEPMDKFGFSIASGDFDGDGYNDIAIGAPFHTPNASLYQQGAVYIYFGPQFTRSVALHASSTNKGLGWAVASGDINNDGIADFLISASGKVLVYHGGRSFAPVIDSPSGVISNTASGFGKSIAVLGDYDSDGRREIAIGAPNATINNNSDTGSVYIISGSTYTTLVQINGVNLFDCFGSSIVVDDLDNDGLLDFAIASPTADTDAALMAGKVYLFKGKDITTSTALGHATVFNGATYSQGYGTFLAYAGNKRLLIGRPYSNDTGGVTMVDLLTGQTVSGGSSGGHTGGDEECH